MVRNDIPDDVIDADYVLLLSILRVADNSGTCLHPRVSTILIHKSVILCHHLSFVDNWKGMFIFHTTVSQLEVQGKESPQILYHKTGTANRVSPSILGHLEGQKGTNNNSKMFLTIFSCLLVIEIVVLLPVV